MTTSKVQKRGKGRKAAGGARRLTPEQEQAVRAKVDADAEAAHPRAMAAYTEAFTLYLHNADALKVAGRCVEIWNAQFARDKEQETSGATYFMSAGIDPMLEASSDGLMVASPNDELFTYVFTRAAAEFKDDPAPNEYTELLDLIRRVDEGADLAELHRQKYGEGEAQQPDPDAELIRRILAAAFKADEARADAESGSAASGSILDLTTDITHELDIFVIHPEIFPAVLPVLVREVRKLEAERKATKFQRQVRRRVGAAFRKIVRQAGE
ncbi:MAG: hypothetical protein ABW208_08870 [Pyrinomonadaceae bacterium]